MAHNHYPKGCGGLFGGGVDVELVMEQGSRAQKRLLARHLARQTTKPEQPKNQKRSARK